MCVLGFIVDDFVIFLFFVLFLFCFVFLFFCCFFLFVCFNSFGEYFFTKDKDGT